MNDIELTLARQWTRDIMTELWSCRADRISTVMAPDIVAIASHEREYLIGPDAVIDHFKQLFAVFPIVFLEREEYHAIALTDEVCLVFGRYLARTALDSGQLLMDEQRLSFLWRQNTSDDPEEPALRLFHFQISNPAPIPQETEKYPVRAGRYSFEYLLAVVDEILSLESKNAILFEARSGARLKGKSLHLVPSSDILYVEACGKDSRLHLTNMVLEIPQGISEVLTQLPPGFVSVHRSYIVSARAVSRLDANSVTLRNGETIPLSRRRRTEARNELIAMLQAVRI